jgi:hypothetical protein
MGRGLPWVFSRDRDSGYTLIGIYTVFVSRRKKLIAFFNATYLTKFFMPAY